MIGDKRNADNQCENAQDQKAPTYARRIEINDCDADKWENRGKGKHRPGVNHQDAFLTFHIIEPFGLFRFVDGNGRLRKRRLSKRVSAMRTRLRIAADILIAFRASNQRHSACLSSCEVPIATVRKDSGR